MGRRRVYSLNTQLQKVTGVEKVMLDIHHAVKDKYDAKIVGNLPYDMINKDHAIRKEDYVKFGNPFIFHKSIVIVHERKLLFPLWVLNTFLFQKITIIYIHHSILSGNKLLTILPKNIVAISDSGIRNLLDYFHADIKNITKIHNCVIDKNPGNHRLCGKETITILYPARINSNKRQIELVDYLKGKIDHRVKIYFAGDGPALEVFQKKVKNDEQFVCLGYRDDILSLLQACDYMMLFSKQEGLPITLIEATMCGTPIICNGVGGNEEVAINGKNAFVSPNANDFDWLVRTINSLYDVTDKQYLTMSQASRLVYEKNFTFDRFKEQYLNLLELATQKNR